MTSSPARLPVGVSHPLPGGLSPDSIDVCSELSTILARVRYTDNKTGTASTNGGDGSGGGAAANQAGGPSSGTAPGAATTASSPSGGGGDDAQGGPLSTKDVPAATDHLKHKIQRARAAVHTLPDIRRSIPEQEAEIAVLEDKIAQQRAVLLQLKEFGLQFAAENSRKADEDIEMGGTAGQHGGSGPSG